MQLTREAVADCLALTANDGDGCKLPDFLLTGLPSPQDLLDIFTEQASLVLDRAITHRHIENCRFSRPQAHKQAIRNSKTLLHKTMISNGCDCVDPILESSAVWI